MCPWWMLSIWSKLRGFWGGWVPVGIKNSYLPQAMWCLSDHVGSSCACDSRSRRELVDVRVFSWLARLSFVPLTHFRVCRSRRALSCPAVLWVKSTWCNAPLWSRMWHWVAHWVRRVHSSSTLKSVCSGLIVQWNACKRVKWMQRRVQLLRL